MKLNRIKAAALGVFAICLAAHGPANAAESLASKMNKMRSHQQAQLANRSEAETFAGIIYDISIEDLDAVLSAQNFNRVAPVKTLVSLNPGRQAEIYDLYKTSIIMTLKRMLINVRPFVIKSFADVIPKSELQETAAFMQSPIYDKVSSAAENYINSHAEQYKTIQMEYLAYLEHNNGLGAPLQFYLTNPKALDMRSSLIEHIGNHLTPDENIKFQRMLKLDEMQIERMPQMYNALIKNISQANKSDVMKIALDTMQIKAAFYQEANKRGINLPEPRRNQD